GGGGGGGGGEGGGGGGEASKERAMERAFQTRAVMTSKEEQEERRPSLRAFCLRESMRGLERGKVRKRWAVGGAMRPDKSEEERVAAKEETTSGGRSCSRMNSLCG
ncbi:hypothetical protein GOP47_0011949, partial [Adiantum capillus-veneris]